MFTGDARADAVALPVAAGVAAPAGLTIPPGL